MRTATLNLLRQAIPHAQAEFRDGQWEAIEAIVERRARLLLVQRTGWGKSLVYFLATRLLRQRSAGCTLLISPLLALMRNQISAANAIGVRAATINSANRDEWAQTESRLHRQECDILLISPERLANEDFVRRSLLPMAGRVGLLVVDEAHCISDWGHDFRPDYRRIVGVLRALPPNIPVLATTATANDRVVNDVAQQLGPGLEIRRGPLTRASLQLQNIYLRTQAARMAWLAHHVPNLPGSGIVYTLTVRDSQHLAEWLKGQGIDAAAYHADLEPEQREALEDRLLRNELKALVATVALGMGFDKPDIGFVIHFQRPASVVHYYQQVGRAGRAVEDAFGILLNGEEDDAIADYFMRTAFPTVNEVDEILGALKAANTPLSIPKLLQRVNQPFGKAENTLRFLMLESPAPVQKTEAGYVLNPVRWSMPRERIERINGLRRQEQERMRAYMASRDCLMRFLAEELSDPSAAACGKCVNCRGWLLSESYPEETVQAAVRFLDGLDKPIQPRRMWPAGLEQSGMRGRIPAEHQPAEGRALCHWGDPGFGDLVRAGKQRTGNFDDRLVDAACRLIAGRWKPDPFPAWVTCVPSRRRPMLVPDFARRLAGKLGLPFVECVYRMRDTEPQKTRENSFQQVQNLIGTFEVATVRVQAAPVVLVDDLVDSRWTFAMVAMLLRKAGSGAVYPFALADSSRQDTD